MEAQEENCLGALSANAEGLQKSTEHCHIQTVASLFRWLALLMLGEQVVRPSGGCVVVQESSSEALTCGCLHKTEVKGHI